MKIIDSHLHLYSLPRVIKEGDWPVDELARKMEELSQGLKKENIEKGLAVVLDTAFLRNEKTVNYLAEEQNQLSNLSFCLSFDFRLPDYGWQLEKAKALGVRAIKIHPRWQKIRREEFSLVGQLTKKAAELGFFIIIDAAFVSQELSYVHLAVELAGFLSRQADCPIILAHTAGAAVFEALTVALEAKNIYLDTSFSLWQWQGSTVEQDLAFAFKKLGAHRCLYGSDAPFVNLAQSIKIAREFFERHNFSQEEKDNIFYQTAKKLLSC